MRSIEDRQQMQASSARVFDALIRPTEICQWWQASSAIVFPEQGGLWAACWGDLDAPDYLTAATLSVFEPGRELQMSDYRYRSKSGPPPFNMDVVVRFLIQQETNDLTLLSVEQSGFPDDPIADDFYAGCVTGWRQTLGNLARLIESTDNG